MTKIPCQVIFYFRNTELDVNMAKQGDSLRIEISERGDITGVGLIISPRNVKQIIQTLEKKYNDIFGGKNEGI